MCVSRVGILRLTLITVVVLCLTNIQADDTDFYTLLGVPRDADNRQIRKAFKQLAVKLHPDKNTVTLFNCLFIKQLTVL